MADVLTKDDPLYEELYDIRREAMEMGNLVEEDMNPRLGALRDRGAVQQGRLRDLLGLPAHQRYMSGRDKPAYTVLDFAACETAFRENGRYSSSVVHHPNPDNEQLMGILEMDGAQHIAFRKTLQPMFIKPRTLTWWRQRWINEIVETLIERLKTQDRAELNIEYCSRVPVHTVTRAIGMEGDDALVFRNALMKSSDLSHIPPDVRKNASDTVWRMLAELIAARRATPGDDVVSKLIAATVTLADGTERPLNDREIAINARLVMVAGGGTSWRQFGITLWALFTHPQQFEALKADRSLVDAAIEESVRWNVTAPVFGRLTTEDVVLGGVAIPSGSLVELVTGAANRDPARWDNPDAYDIFRPFKPHIGFGIGQHQCLGMNVARSELNVGINALLDAFPDIRLDPDQPAPFLTGGLEQRGMSAIPVLLR
ncbi:MAG: cytochrome P450 [Sphingomonas sp.]